MYMLSKDVLGRAKVYYDDAVILNTVANTMGWENGTISLYWYIASFPEFNKLSHKQDEIRMNITMQIYHEFNPDKYE